MQQGWCAGAFRRSRLGGSAIVLVLAMTGCSSAAPREDPNEPEPSQAPPAAQVDWVDSTKSVQLEGGWTVSACEGDAPLLCVARNGAPVGVVEATAYPVDSFDDLDPQGEASDNLRELAAGFVEALRQDRDAGCPEGYDFDPHDPVEIELGGNEALAYGYTGTMPDGSPSELNLQYSTIVGDRIISIVAIAYDEGGCPGRDDLSGFDSAQLAEVRDQLEALLQASPLPEV